MSSLKPIHDTVVQAQEGGVPTDMGRTERAVSCHLSTQTKHFGKI